MLVVLCGDHFLENGSSSRGCPRHTCSPKRGNGSPCGPGRVSGVSVRAMAEEKIFMMSLLDGNWPSSVGISLFGVFLLVRMERGLSGEHAPPSHRN